MRHGENVPCQQVMRKQAVAFKSETAFGSRVIFTIIIP